MLTAIRGAGLCLLSELLRRWNNAGQICAGELNSMLIITVIAAVIAVYQYAVYRLSVRKTGRLLKL